MHAQRGVALVIVLIALAAGTLLVTPTLRYAAGALKFLSVSRDSASVQYALTAVTQQALALLQYDTSFKDCDGDLLEDSFAKCVAAQGKWTLATPSKLTGVFNETQVERVNDQEVTVSVEVPGALSAPPAPTPIPTAGDCMFAWVVRNPTWVQVGEAITYDVHVLNCSSSNSVKHLRRVVVLMDPAFDYGAGSSDNPPPSQSLFAGWPEGSNKEPQQARCTGLNTPYIGCKANDNSLLLAWPSVTTNFGGSTPVTLAGGEEKVLRFQALPTTWGIVYADISFCAFAATTSVCDGQIDADPFQKVAPVVVGMFNIKGQGKGYAFGASSRLTNGDSSLISETPQ